MPNIKVILILITLSSCFLFSSKNHAADIYNGKKIYQDRCALCHGKGGRAEMPGTPDLSKQQGMQKSNNFLLNRIKQGKGSCPPYGGILKEDQINDVVNFIRTLRYN